MRYTVLARLALALAVVAILQTGCGRHFGVNRIRVQYGLSGPDAETFQRMVSLFNDQYGGDIEVEAQHRHWDEFFTAWLASFKAKNPPDAVLYHISEVPEYVEKGVCEPLDELAKREKLDLKDILDSPRKAAYYKGKLYAVPLDIHPLGLYYNVKAVKQAGLDPNKPPTNREQLLAWAKKLTVDLNGDGKIDRYGIAMPATNVMSLRAWYSWLHQNGGAFLDKSNKKCTANSPQGVEALQFAVDLIYKYKVAPPGESDPDKDFMTEKVAMTFQGPWYINGFLAQKGLEFRTAKFPVVFGKPAVWASDHFFSLSKQEDPDRKRSAMVFIKWMSDNSWMWAQSGQIPVRKSILKSKKFTKSSIFGYQKPFVDQVGEVVYTSLVPVHTQIFAENVQTPLVQNLQAALLLRKTPKQALDDCAAGVDKLLASSGR